MSTDTDDRGAGKGRGGDKARAEVYEHVYPRVKKALEDGNYEFIAKNEIRIWVLEMSPYYEGEMANIRSIELSWT